MTASWQKIPLKDLLTKSENWIELKPDGVYREITVRLWGKGVVLRGEVTGMDVATKQKNLARSGQLILSKIDARHGAFGIVPASLDGAVVSGDFPIFNINSKKVVPQFLEWVTKTKKFAGICMKASEGTTNRVRLKEEKFLRTDISIPPLEEQHKICDYLNVLASKLAERKINRDDVLKKTSQLVALQFRKFIKNNSEKVKLLPFTDFTRLERRPVAIVPEDFYKEIGTYSYGRGIFHKTPRSGFEVGNKDLFVVKENDLILQITFAWEGAVALAGPQDNGLYCSVRYPTFRVDETICLPGYVLMYLKTEEGVSKLGQLSPGSAGRNRVLSLKRLNELIVPIVPLEMQRYLIEKLEKRTAEILRLENEIDSISQKIIPSVLDKAFKGQL